MTQTVNTASRMESNGLPGHIHISQTTADLVIAGGRAHWVHAREEKIIAKGTFLYPFQTCFIVALA